MKGGDFLSVAQRLVQGSSEADWRSAVSRGYYAAFHLAKDFLGDLGFTIPRADSAHIYLCRRLSIVTAADIARAGTELNLLRSERNKADYDCDKPFTLAMAKQSVITSEHIVAVFSRALQEPMRSQLTAEIRHYETTVLAQSTWHN